MAAGGGGHAQQHAALRTPALATDANGNYYLTSSPSHLILAAGAISHSDGTNSISGSQRYFIGNNLPSADDSALLIGRGLTGSYSSGAHAIRDESTYSASGTGLFGYASYDSIPVFTGASSYNHLHSFQARPNYSGTGAIGDVSSFTAQATLGSTGTVTNLYGIQISDALGTGPVTNHYAIWINPLSRATNNYALYSGSAALKSYHGGPMQFGTAPSISAAGFTTYGSLLSIDATGNLLSNSNITIINGVLTLKTSTAKVLATGADLALDSSAGKVILGGSSTSVTIASALVVKNYVVSGLPAASVPYQKAFVTDATASTFYSVVVGGGTITVPVFSDGTNWRIG